MRLLHNGSAIIIGLILGVVGFLLYHKQNNLPLADVMGSQTIAGDISYQLTTNNLIISNTANTLLGTLKVSITYDPTTVKLLTNQITSKYEYSFGS
jgi:hypothetical protein